MVPIGARVRELRKARGLRMKALPFSRAYISRLELGGFLPGPDRIAALAESLGVSARTLLGSEEEWQLGQLSDPFILEAANDLLNLTMIQRAQVLDVLQSLSERG